METRKSRSDHIPLEIQLSAISTYRYFDWMSPTTGKLIPYITTVLDDGAYEVRAAVEPQNKKGFRGKTCSGAWVTLTREINKHMVSGKVSKKVKLDSDNIPSATARGCHQTAREPRFQGFSWAKLGSSAISL